MFTFCSGVKLRRVLSISGSLLNPLFNSFQQLFHFRLEQNNVGPYAVDFQNAPVCTDDGIFWSNATKKSGIDGFVHHDDDCQQVQREPDQEKETNYNEL